MPNRTDNNPLHGVTLETILVELVDRCGWDEMSRAVDIRCFKFDPSIGSSLQFLRRTPWARAKVEELYLKSRSQSPAADLPFKARAPVPAPFDPLTPQARLPARHTPSPADILLGRAGEARKKDTARLRSVQSYDRSALRSHTINRSHAQFKSDNSSKV